MMHRVTVLTVLVLSVVLGACLRLKEYDFPVGIDTAGGEVRAQRSQLYPAPEMGLSVDDLFAGGKLDAFFQRGDTTLVAEVEPEAPASRDPWYALRIRAEKPARFTLRLNYRGGRHAYAPRVRRGAEDWELLDPARYRVAPDSSYLLADLEVDQGEYYFAGQEVIGSEAVQEWCRVQVGFSGGRAGMPEVGRSFQGRPLPALDIGPAKGKDLIVLFCRARPAGTAGYIALQAFVEALFEKGPLTTEFLSRYRVLVFPLLNPDGADLGHWQYNAAGADLRYDWAAYRQPETRAVAEYLVKTVKANRHRSVLALDFRSGPREEYVMAADACGDSFPGLPEGWMRELGRNDADPPSVLRTTTPDMPVLTNWACRQFGGAGIQLVSAFDSGREELRRKGRLEARALMKYLAR